MNLKGNKNVLEVKALQNVSLFVFLGDKSLWDSPFLTKHELFNNNLNYLYLITIIEKAKIKINKCQM